MSANVNNWGSTCETWSSNCNLWSRCISEVVEIIEGGTRDPAFWGDHPFDLYNKDLELEKYQQEQPQKQQRLIQIYVKCANRKYNKNIVIPENKVKVNIRDVEFILTTLKEVGVDIKNINKYNDGELRNLLG
jgi:hypothetical protein